MKRDSLTKLIARSFGLAEVIQPVLPSRFEPIGRVPLPDIADFAAEGAPDSAAVVSQEIRPAIERVQPVAPARQPELEAIQAPEVKTVGHVAPPPKTYAASALLSLPSSERRRARVASPALFKSDEPRDGTIDLKPRSRQQSVAADPAARETITPRLETRKHGEKPLEGQGINREISPADVRVRAPERAAPSTRTEPQAERVQRSASDVSRQADSQEQKVTVHIGRIEVRAVLEPARAPERKQAADSRPRLSLSDYLKQREKGAR